MEILSQETLIVVGQELNQSCSKGDEVFVSLLNLEVLPLYMPQDFENLGNTQALSIPHLAEGNLKLPKDP